MRCRLSQNCVKVRHKPRLHDTYNPGQIFLSSGHSKMTGTIISFAQTLADRKLQAYSRNTHEHVQHLRISPLCLLTAKLLLTQPEPPPKVGWLIRIRTRIRAVYTNAVRFNPDSNPD